jgi:hypothetical protein
VIVNSDDHLRLVLKAIFPTLSFEKD